MYIAGDIKAKTCLDIARKSIGADSCKDNITGKNIGVAVIDTGIYPHENIKNNIVPVSYTHLDVYKRQQLLHLAL